MLALVGPTGSGKSSVAMEVAERCGGEIICCDSVQIYRGFDVGSASPSAADVARIPHHLVNIIDGDVPFDVRDYQRHATAAIEEIRGRGKIPILCGGTGLYLRALRWGLLAGPSADEELREKLREQEHSRPGSILQQLRVLDPQSAESIEANNLVHLTRALEICILSGEKASDLKAAHGFEVEEVPMRVVVLRWPTEVLRQRIRERVGQMLDDGLLAEVSSRVSGGMNAHHRPMRAVGYRECLSHLTQTADEEELKKRISVSTARYAKRQRTWFRKEKNLEFADIGSPEELKALAAALSDGVD